jgi:hypothetical protein
LGQIPDAALYEMAEQLVHRIAIGHRDLDGDDFGTIFAKAIGGEHRGSPLGIADVVQNGCAWSVKTVAARYPFTAKGVRLISGRNAPVYSSGITKPLEDLQATGAAVLSIWNARVNEAHNQHDDLRIAVLIRNMVTRQFHIFEEEALRFTPADFEWSLNPKGNLEGRDKVTKQHRFTWQPHGAQFTVLRHVPASARKFSVIRNVPIVSPESVLESIGYGPDWVEVHGQE